MELITLLAAIGAGVIAYRAYKEARGQTRAAVVAARAAKRSAETAAKQLQVAERPWVSVSARIAGPMTFDTSGARVPVVFTLKNEGKSVALGLALEAGLFPFLNLTDANQALSEQKRICDKLRVSPPTPGHWEGGDALFPAQEMVWQRTLSLPWREIWKATSAKDPAILPYTTGCVAYRFTYAPDVHLTGFYWAVAGTNVENPGIPYAIKPISGDVPEEKLAIVPLPIGGHWAD